MENISPQDFDKICRTCLSEGELKPLYGKCPEDYCLIEMLMTVTFIQISEKDRLPLQICLKCEAELIQAYNFAQKCEEAESKLKSIFVPLNAKVGIKRKSSTPSELIENKIKFIFNELPPFIIDSLEPEPNKKIQELKQKIPEPKPKPPEPEIEVIVTEDFSEHDHNYAKKTVQYSENIPENNIPETAVIEPQPEIEKKPDSPLPYECKKCFAKFRSFQLLRLHWDEVQHPHNGYMRKICHICSRSVGYSRMKQHMRTHTKEKPFCCEFCGKKFSERSNLSRHLKCHTEDRIHKCPHCDKSFIQANSFKQHLRTHTGERLVCSYCNKTFTQDQGYRQHLKQHINGTVDQKNHECQICHKKYRTKTILKNHMRSHGPKTFSCTYCKLSFVSKGGLVAHTKVHLDEKPYQCLNCDKKFREKCGLKSHTLMHSTEKPIKCEICDKKFSKLNHLKAHLKIHIKEKTFSCPLCGKSFSSDDNLAFHLKTHTEEIPYLRPACGEDFYNINMMNKHLKIHKEED